jgi:proteasome lid subunit RPN8/RPN11
MPFILQQKYISQMIEYAIELLPEEACGLIFGKNDEVFKIFYIENEYHSPVQFRMNPQQQLEALIWGEENNMDIMGIFHSHPKGPSHPSDTDLMQFYFSESMMVILSLLDTKWQCKAFKVENKKYKEILIQICNK